MNKAFDEQKKRIRAEILAELSDRRADDEMLKRLIDERLMEEAELSLKEKLHLRAAVFNSLRRLDVLSELLDDGSVTEIMINAADEIFIEKNGRMQRWEKRFESEEQLEDLIQQIVAKINRVVNTASPIVDARLTDGSRVHCVLPPIALKGATMTIRKFPEPITMERLVASGSITQEAADFLKDLVRAGYNLFISGGTNSGKTTFLNALSAFIPSEERVITIEDSAELQIRQLPNLVRLETRNANAEGEGEISMSDLIRASLRMAPNRILVGEVRGKECLDMLSAMNTGHSGSISTGHGNSAQDMLKRMETMVLQGAELPVSAIRGQIASAIEVMVHLGRLKDRKRRVLEISEIRGMENGEIKVEPLFSYDGRALQAVGALQNREKLLLRL